MFDLFEKFELFRQLKFFDQNKTFELLMVNGIFGNI